LVIIIVIVLRRRNKKGKKVDDEMPLETVVNKDDEKSQRERAKTEKKKQKAEEKNKKEEEKKKKEEEKKKKDQEGKTPYQMQPTPNSPIPTSGEVDIASLFIKEFGEEFKLTGVEKKKKIGSGNFGDVYLATLAGEENVAMKSLKAEQEDVKAFISEIKLAKKSKISCCCSSFWILCFGRKCFFGFGILCKWIFIGLVERKWRSKCINQIIDKTCERM